MQRNITERRAYHLLIKAYLNMYILIYTVVEGAMEEKVLRKVTTGINKINCSEHEVWKV